jgi:hypothetical protein
MHSSRKEWEELAFDTRMAKKLKQGKLSQHEFDRMMGEDVDDDAHGKPPAPAQPAPDSKSSGGAHHMSDDSDFDDAPPPPKKKKAPVVVIPARDVIKRRRLARMRAKQEERKGKKAN